MRTNKNSGTRIEKLVNTTGYVLLILFIVQVVHHYLAVYTNVISNIEGGISENMIDAAGAVQVTMTIGVVVVVSLMLPRGKKPVDDDDEREPEPKDPPG